MTANGSRVVLVSICLALSLSIAHAAYAQNNPVNTVPKVTNTTNRGVNAGVVNTNAVNAVSGAGGQNSGTAAGQSVNANINTGNGANASINTNFGAGPAGKLNGPASQQILNPGNLRGVGLKDLQSALNTGLDALQQAGITEGAHVVGKLTGGLGTVVQDGGKFFIVGGTLGNNDPTGIVEINPTTDLTLGQQESLGVGKFSGTKNSGGSSTGSSGSSSGSGSGSGSGNSSGTNSDGSRQGGQSTANNRSTSGGSGGAQGSGKKEEKIIDVPVLQNVDNAINGGNGIGAATGVQTDLNVNLNRGVGAELNQNLAPRFNEAGVGGLGNATVRSLPGGSSGGASLPGATGLPGAGLPGAILQRAGSLPGLNRLPGTGSVLPGVVGLPGKIPGAVGLPGAGRIPGVTGSGVSGVNLPGLLGGLKTGAAAGVRIPAATGAGIVKQVTPVINAGRTALGGGRLPATGGGTGGAVNPVGGRIPLKTGR